MAQFHFDPTRTSALMAEEVPAYARLQDEVAAATAGVEVARALELGTGTGETARRVLAVHREATLTGVDASADMLAHADLPGADLRVARLEEDLRPWRSRRRRSYLVAGTLAPRGCFVSARRPRDPATPPIDGLPRAHGRQLGCCGAGAPA